MISNLVARKEEIRRLERCMEEKTAQLVILYGRRRVGKTFLINQFFDGRFDFKITGAYKEKRETQLRFFTEELSSQTRQDRKSTRLNSSHPTTSRMPSSA